MPTEAGLIKQLVNIQGSSFYANKTVMNNINFITSHKCQMGLQVRTVIILPMLNSLCALQLVIHMVSYQGDTSITQVEVHHCENPKTQQVLNVSKWTQTMWTR